MPSWGHEGEHQSPGAGYKLGGLILGSTSPQPSVDGVQEDSSVDPEKNGDLVSH